METKSKVKLVVGNGTWQKDGKTYYKWEIHMENGDVGGAMTAAQQQDKWVVGKEVTYTKNVNGQYTNFKLVENKPDFKGKYEPKDQGIITMLSCISSACHAVAQSSSHNNTEIILGMANKFYDAAVAKTTLPKQI